MSLLNNVHTCDRTSHNLVNLVSYFLVLSSGGSVPTSRLGKVVHIVLCTVFSKGLLPALGQVRQVEHLLGIFHLLGVIRQLNFLFQSSFKFGERRSNKAIISFCQGNIMKTYNILRDHPMDETSHLKTTHQFASQ